MFSLVDEKMIYFNRSTTLISIRVNVCLLRVSHVRVEQFNVLDDALPVSICKKVLC